MSTQSSFILSAFFEENGNGVYIGFVKEINGAIAEGNTFEETQANLIEVAEAIIKYKLEHGVKVLDNPLIYKNIEVFKKQS